LIVASPHELLLTNASSLTSYQLVGHILKVHDVVVNYSALSRAMTEDTGEGKLRFLYLIKTSRYLALLSLLDYAILNIPTTKDMSKIPCLGNTLGTIASHTFLNFSGILLSFLHFALHSALLFARTQANKAFRLQPSSN